MSAQHWDSREVQIKFSRNNGGFVGVELTLRARPNIKLTLYELGDGLHIARGAWKGDNQNTVIPTGLGPTDKNEGFVEACVNQNLLDKNKADPGVPFEKTRLQGASLARKGKLSPETLEVFQVHVASHKGMLAQTKRRQKVDAMKSIVKQLGDLTEDEMLDIWREARAEEVMES
jgi:hypothetical protein